MDQWYYAVNGQQQGPVTEEQLVGLITAGQIAATTLVWREGMSEWVAAHTVLNMPAAAPQPAPAPGGPGIAYETPTNPYQQIGYGQEYGIPLSQDSNIFWLRVGGRIIDVICLYIIIAIVAVPVGIVMGMSASHSRQVGGPNAVLLAVQGVLFLFEIGAYWLYFALFESSKYQATLGKMACKLRVVDMAGQRISFGRASGRAFAGLINSFCCLIYLTAAFSDKKQGVHDMIAGTLVVRQNSILN